ncbi:MAG: hypothetical protein K8F26_12435 [Thiobacillus sp.]|nr:hypothetical protein [Thiobacillus sp.]
MSELLCFFVDVRGEVWAAWIQAILSGVAIYASVRLVNHQHKLELKREANGEVQRKRQHLESAFQLIGAVYRVTNKIKEWSKVKGGEPDDLLRMRLELEGLADALRQTDFGRFDQHMPIEATLVALSSARFMLARIAPSEYAGSFTSPDEIGKTASDLSNELKKRLDKIHAEYPTYHNTRA